MYNTFIFKFFCLFILLVVFFSCKEEKVPTVTTSEITDITGTTAKCGGTITDEGSGTVIMRGVCWNTEIDPTTDDNKGITTDGAGAGTFISDLTNLSNETTYYVRAYASNNTGTGYGMVMSFSTIGCKFCRTVSTDSSNGNVTEGPEDKYCGDELIAIEASNPITVGTVTTMWVCSDKP